MASKSPLFLLSWEKSPNDEDGRRTNEHIFSCSVTVTDTISFFLHFASLSALPSVLLPLARSPARRPQAKLCDTDPSSRNTDLYTLPRFSTKLRMLSLTFGIAAAAPGAPPPPPRADSPPSFALRFLMSLGFVTLL